MMNQLPVADSKSNALGWCFCGAAEVLFFHLQKLPVTSVPD